MAKLRYGSMRAQLILSRRISAAGLFRGGHVGNMREPGNGLRA